MKTWTTKIRSAWRALRGSDKRWLFAAASLLALLGAREVLLRQGSDESAMLFAGLPAAEERAVLRHLQVNAIPFRQNEEGIFVRKDMIESLRAQIVERKDLGRSRFVQEASARIRPRAAMTRPQCKFGGR